MAKLYTSVNGSCLCAECVDNNILAECAKEDGNWKEYQDDHPAYGNYVSDEGAHTFVCESCHNRCCHVDNCQVCRWEEEVHSFFTDGEPTKDELAWIDDLIGYRAYHDRPSHDLRNFFDHDHDAWSASEVVKKLRDKLDDYLTDNDMESDFADEATFADVKRHMM